MRKLNIFDKIILKIFGFNLSKINKWLKNKNILTLKEYHLLKKEQQGINKEIRGLKLDKQNPKKSLAKLKKIEGRLNNLHKNLDKGDLIFKSFFEFKKFAWWFEFIFLDTGMPFRNINHEKQHADFLSKHNIQYQFGWKKLFNENQERAAFIPFILANIPRRLKKKSITSAKELSPEDKIDLGLMKKC